MCPQIGRQTAPTLDQIVGPNLKRLRESAGLAQVDLAERINAVARLSWGQGTVAWIETARRPLRLAELLLLPGVLNIHRQELLTELLRTDADLVRIGTISINREQWIELVQGTPVNITDPQQLQKALTRENSKRWTQLLRRAARFGVEENDVWKGVAASLTAAERRVAAKLDSDNLDVGFASVSLWGHSMTEERERLLAEEEGESDPRQRRGHITRTLQAQIHDVIRDARRKGRKRTWARGTHGRTHPPASSSVN